MKAQRQVSVILLLIGIILLAQPVIFPQATVTYTPLDSISIAAPSGCTSSTAPCNFIVDASVALTVSVNAGRLSCCSVSVAGSSTYYGGPTILAYDSAASGCGSTCANIFKSSWTVPAAPTTTTQSVTISYVDAVDTINGVSQTGSASFYYTIASGITGYCDINGQQVSTSSSISVTSPTLTFDCYVTSGQSLVGTAAITVTQGSTTLTTLALTNAGGGHYGTGNFTLPAAGSYTINGYFTPTYSGPSIYVMSVFMPYGLPAANLPQLTIYQDGGVIFIVLGGAWLALERMNKSIGGAT